VRYLWPVTSRMRFFRPSLTSADQHERIFYRQRKCKHLSDKLLAEVVTHIQTSIPGTNICLNVSAISLSRGQSWPAEIFACFHRQRFGAFASKSCALYAILAFAANHDLVRRIKEREIGSMFAGKGSSAKMACPWCVRWSSIMFGRQSG
jgi:hypothetical protein